MKDDSGTPKHRLYPIKSAEPYWLAGFTRDGRQALILQLGRGTSFRAILFDPRGAFLAVDQGGNLDEWLREVGFEPGTIRVRKFEQGGVLIRDMAAQYVGFLKDPDEWADTPASKARITAWIQEWRDRGRFVLVWGDEMWVDGDGTVIAT
jgi:hypothetical protein